LKVSKDNRDIAATYICALKILGCWRENIATAVSEGEVYETYSNKLLPSPTSESEVLAMQLVHFQKIDNKKKLLR